MNIQQFNWWCDDYKQTPDDWFIRFFQYCSDQYEDVDNLQVNIYSVFAFHPNQHPSKDHVNFFFIGENTSIFYSNGHLFDAMDAVLTFFHDTPKSFRFPLWLIYWNFYTDGLFEIPQNCNDKNHACIIVSHDQSGHRNVVCHKISSYMEVDSNFNGVAHTRLIDVPSGIIAKRNFMKSYRYNICLENSIRDGYVTEKVFESLYSGCIPIYNGPTDIEPNILNRQDIVHVLDEHVDFNKKVSNETWKPDALVYIFACYLKLWSKVFLKYNLRKLKNTVILQKYECNSKEECVDILKNHWLKYQQLFSPRAHFFVNNIEYYMEDLADDIYQQYSL
jgi:alpha(1,3/1,4) fucosyltransferase